MATNYPQAPTLFEFGQRAAQLREIERRRAIDQEAVKRSLQLQQVAARNQIALQGLAQNLGNAELNGLLQRELESRASPEMARAYGEQARTEGLRQGRQSLQDFLMAPERMPDQPQRKGLGGFLQRAVTPQIDRDYSVYQKGLFANALAGQPVESPTGAADFRPPEEREKSELNQAHIQYWRAGGSTGRGQLIAVDEEGNQRFLTPGEKLQPGEKMYRPGTQAQTREADAYRNLNSITETLSIALTPYTNAKGQIDTVAADQDDFVKGLRRARDRLLKQISPDEEPKPEGQGGPKEGAAASEPTGAQNSELVAWARSKGQAAWPQFRDQAIARGVNPAGLDALQRAFAADDIQGMETALRGAPTQPATTAEQPSRQPPEPTAEIEPTPPEATPTTAAAEVPGRGRYAGPFGGAYAVPARPEPVQARRPQTTEIPAVEGKLARVAPGQMAGSVPQTPRFIRTATNPQTGQKLGWDGSRWVEIR